MIEDAISKVLYPLQEAVLWRLQAMGDAQFGQAKLCGGTALSRCWLDHRVSFDLDFFLPEGFEAGKLAMTLKSAGVAFETLDIVDDLRKANQLHGYAIHQGQRLKVSFVEDAYFNVYPAIEKFFGRLTVRTEDVAGLYHRKLRTVAGGGAAGDSFQGGRQKARDLFDLYVLSQAVMPVKPFMATLPYAFPSAAFDNGLANMPWLELMDELQELICDPKWLAAKDVAFLQAALYEQIGAQALDDFAPDQDLAPGTPQSAAGHRRGGVVP